MIKILIVIILLMGGVFFFADEITGLIALDRPTVKIATWNIENFGQKKARDDAVMDRIAGIMDDYDIVAIQEISNVDEMIDQGCLRNQDACPGERCGLIHDALSSRLSDLNYTILISPQVRDERYAFVVNTNVVRIINTSVLPDPDESGHLCDLDSEDAGVMLRQPFFGVFEVDDWQFGLMTVHTSPSNNAAEFEGLEYFYDSANDQLPTILLGDLNADCDYLPKNVPLLKDAITPDSFDTTVSKTDCAYDRIIIPDSLQKRVSSKQGVDTRVTRDLSDHYVVWAELYID